MQVPTHSIVLSYQQYCTIDCSGTAYTTTKAKDQGLPTPIQYPIWWYQWCTLWYTLCMQGTMYPPLSQCDRDCTHSVCTHEVCYRDRCPYLLLADHLLGVLVPSQDLPRPCQPTICRYQWWYYGVCMVCMHYGSHRVHHLCTLPMQHTVSQYQYGVSYTLYQWSDLVSRGLVVGTNPQYSTQLLVVPYYRLHSTVCTTSKAKDQGLPTPIQYPMWWYVWCMLWYILCMQGTMYPPLSQCSRVCTHSVCAHEVSQWDRMSLSIGTDHLLGVLVLLRPPQTLHRNPISTPILYQYSTSTTPTTTSRYSLSLVCRGIHSTTSGVYIVVYMVHRKWCIRYLDTY